MKRKGNYMGSKNRIYMLLTLFSAIVCGFAAILWQPTAAAENKTRDQVGPSAVKSGESFDDLNSVTFTNPSSITINASGPAAPYPSAINVSNAGSRIAKITVALNGFGHTFPDDVDIVLVGPGGQTAVLMSDVGGTSDVVGVNLIFDDAATTVLPDFNAILSGTYKPTNIGTVDNFPAPAPANNGGSALSVFNNTNPNGTWHLFVFDDTGTDGGSVSGGWSLTIENAISGENTNAISIPDSGPASIYPSQLEVINNEGLITGMQVNLINFSHTSPDDVDLVLVSPSGRKVVLMSDVGGANPVSNVSLTFDDFAANPLPDNSVIATGTYRPTDFEPGDSFPAPAPDGPPTGARLSSLNGSAANGTWQLFLVDDTGSNAGSIAGGWNVSLQTSSSVISIPSSGAADPYPSSLQITGQAGNVTSVVVTLNNFSHTSPDDVDVLLVAPNGRRIVLMSDVGGNTEVGGLNLIFNDAAASALPDDAPLASGTYKPTNFELGDVFPAPAPQEAPTGTTLNAFYGSAANGLWRLFVVDDNGNNIGSIAGSWTLDIQSSVSACLFTVSPTVQAFPITGGSGSFAINMPSGCSWTASTGSGFLTINSSNSGDGSGTIAFSVAPNMEGGRSGTIEVSNGVTVRSFQVQQGSGCPFALNQTALNFTSSAGTGSVAVSAGSACSYQASASAGWIQITSGQQTGDGTITFNVSANTSNQSRTATIFIGARSVTVNQSASTARRFDFDGDGKSDVSIYRPSTGIWYLLNSAVPGSYSAVQFGLSTDRIAPADYDGDRKADVAVYRPSEGVWYIFQSQTGTVRTEAWGLQNDVPMPGDFDGDGRADLTVYRSTDNTWYVRRSTDQAYQAIQLGQAGDKPIAGDFDGDARTDFAVYRAGVNSGSPSSWIVMSSSSGQQSTQQFGNSGDMAMAADFDGDGRDNMVVFRPSTGFWYTSTDPNTNYGGRQWGLPGDVPAPGDYNGDGRADFAVYRQGVWYILHSNDLSDRTETWGLNSDSVVSGAFSAQ